MNESEENINNITNDNINSEETSQEINNTTSTPNAETSKEKYRFNKKKFVLFLARILLLFFITLLIFSIYKIVIYFLDSKTIEKISSDISNLDVKENKSLENPKDLKINFEKLKEKNPDTVAWLEVPNTEVEFPVVKTTNNDFYMNHNFYKTYNAAGWIFMDYTNKLDGSDKNIVVYGHNRRDGTMFGPLTNILNEAWYNDEKNSEIVFITENDSSKYKVFSVYQIEEEDYYIRTNIPDNEYETFLNTLKSRSIKDFGVELAPTDKILTLSTCANSNQFRIVLHAKKMEK